jgi:hypothetical protein
MCLVSEKIKFCTCVTDSAEKLNNYWILHRFNARKDVFVLGMPLIPELYILNDMNYNINMQTLATRLNEPDAFDIPLTFKEKDQFEIVLNNLSKDEYRILTYCFIFKKGLWVKETYDSFRLMNKYDEYAFGKMKGSKKK